MRRIRPREQPRDRARRHLDIRRVEHRRDHSDRVGAGARKLPRVTGGFWGHYLNGDLVEREPAAPLKTDSFAVSQRGLGRNQE